MSLIKRIKAPTPRWFKDVIYGGIILASAGVTIKMMDAQMDDFTLYPIANTICNYAIIAGAVAAAVAKTAKDFTNEDSE